MGAIRKGELTPDELEMWEWFISGPHLDDDSSKPEPGFLF